MCGALKVYYMIAEGTQEKDAANTFSKKILGSID